jgi:hypothetical protein
VKRGSRVAVVDRAVEETVLYDVVLLAGTPKRLTVRLSADLITESVVEIGDARWTVADVRHPEGAPPQLICIYID